MKIRLSGILRSSEDFANGLNPNSGNLTASSIKSYLLKVRIKTVLSLLMKLFAISRADTVLPNPGACLRSKRYVDASGCILYFAYI